MKYLLCISLLLALALAFTSNALATPNPDQQDKANLLEKYREQLAKTSAPVEADLSGAEGGCLGEETTITDCRRAIRQAKKNHATAVAEHKEEMVVVEAPHIPKTKIPAK